MYNQIVNDKQLGATVSEYLQNPEAEILVVFGHPGIGKTEITMREAKELGIDLLPIKASEVSAWNQYADKKLLISGSVQEITDALPDILRVDWQEPCIVEVAVEYEGEARMPIIDNAYCFKWVFYRESLEDYLDYATHNNTLDSFIIDFLKANPDSFSSYQTREKCMLQEAQNILDEISAEPLNSDSIGNLLQKVIRKAISYVQFATIDDEVLRYFVQLALSIFSPLLDRNDLRDDESVKVFRMVTILHKHILYLP